MASPAPPPAPPQTVVLHVGTPKSGTTFLQRALWATRDQLLDAGVRCPGDRQRDMFLAAVEVRDRHEAWGLHAADLAGTWQRLCQEARDFPGISVMSHELLAGASPDQIDAALAGLDGLDVHLVVTARDLARQVVSEWQERVKNGKPMTFATFERAILSAIEAQQFETTFWLNQHLPHILDRWAGGLPKDRVHVVVAPRRGADPLELWRRFGAAAGFDGAAIEPTLDEAANETLGATQVAVLRQVNEALGGRIVQPEYAHVVKRFLGQNLLTRYPTDRPACPPDLVEVLRDLSQTWVDDLTGRGYQVHGELAELLPATGTSDAPHPDQVDHHVQADVSAAVIADLLVEVGRLRDSGRETPAPAPAEVPAHSGNAARPIAVADEPPAPRPPTRTEGRTQVSGPAAAAERHRVFLHVGSPKTGTTFLQNVLWSQRELAAEQGLLLPLERYFDHFLATLDVRDLAGRKEHPPRAVGIWKRLVDEAERWPGTVLVSHELFAAATEEQAARAVASFGPDTDVHVVLTARDLLRQIPAEWQEHVKHRSSRTMDSFVDGIRADHESKTWFWRVQDFASVLERWGAALPADRVHVVTVPPSGSDPEILWRRFAELLGLDPEPFDTTSSRSNTSLGVEQAELLRRVNAELGDRVRLPGPYPAVVKNVLAHRVLAARTGTPLAMDLAGTEFAVRRSAEIAERLEGMGVDVVGDLAELVPDRVAARAAANPTAYRKPSAEVLLGESVAALAGLLDAMAARTSQRQYEDLVKELKQAPVRFVLRQASERNAVLRKARSGVRRVRHPNRDA